MINKEPVIATLKYGAFLSGALFALVLLMLCLGLVGIVLIGIISILMACGVIEYETSSLMSLIVPPIMFFGGIMFAAYLLKRRKTQKREIQLWLQDAISLKAYAQIKDVFKVVGQAAAVEIEVRFTYQNIHYVKDSSGISGPFCEPGHDKIFRHFANREITILYSQKYDQVMFIKDW